MLRLQKIAVMQKSFTVQILKKMQEMVLPVIMAIHLEDQIWRV